MCPFGKLLFRMDGGGFEPPKALLTDLQSAPFGHSGIHPKCNISQLSLVNFAKIQDVRSH